MNTATTELSPVEQGTLEVLVDAVRALGLPRSVGEIYGILYLSPEPLCMDDIVRKLGISIGSASQGLRQLRAFKAVRTVYIQGQRKDYYAAQTSLRELSARFIKEELTPRLEATHERLDTLQTLAADSPEPLRTHHIQQLQHLRRWQTNGLRVLRLLDKLL